MERFATGSPLSANFPTPSDSDQWLPQDFPDDLFGGTSELSQALSGESHFSQFLGKQLTFTLSARKGG